MIYDAHKSLTTTKCFKKWILKMDGSLVKCDWIGNESWDLNGFVQWIIEQKIYIWNFDTKTVIERYLATERRVVDIISRNFEWEKCERKNVSNRKHSKIEWETFQTI